MLYAFIPFRKSSTPVCLLSDILFWAIVSDSNTTPFLHPSSQISLLPAAGHKCSLLECHSYARWTYQPLPSSFFNAVYLFSHIIIYCVYYYLNKSQDIVCKLLGDNILSYIIFHSKGHGTHTDHSVNMC